MSTLTNAQCEIINNATYTHDYEDEATAEFEDEDILDVTDKYIERFESESGINTEGADDLGGIIVYMKANELIGFYDYEQFKGAIFN
jgi:hypothetical protein